MKIASLEYVTSIQKPKKVFRIALTTTTETRLIFLKLTTDTGISGYGEASPFTPVTNETEYTVIAAFEKFRSAVIGADPFDLEKIHQDMDALLEGNTSAKAAVDIALYDIIGKAAGQPVWKLLGSANNKLVTDVTIGIDTPSEMAKTAREWVDEGFDILKIKTGIDPADDIEAIKLIREAVGPDVVLRTDANQGYDIETAAATANKLISYGVIAMEQPLPAKDIEGLAAVRSKAGGMQIIADEALHCPEDAVKIINAGAADILNIKLMKCGGIYPALKIASVAEANGIPCMVGCMNEDRIAITAAMSVVASRSIITEADCDSVFLSAGCDLNLTGGFTNDGGSITLLDKPGLGIEIDF